MISRGGFFMWVLGQCILCSCILPSGDAKEEEDADSIDKKESVVAKSIDISPSGTLSRGCEIEREEQTVPKSGTGIPTPVPTRYMMEIDDCLPEYCVHCPLWKPVVPRHFCWLKFRCRVRFLVERKYFEWFILATVFCSSFTLVLYVCFLFSIRLL